MAGGYKLSNPFLTAARVERSIKKIFNEEEEDRRKAVEAYDFFFSRLQKDPANKELLDGAVKFFQQVIKVKEKTTKIIDLFLRTKLAEKKTSPKSKTKNTTSEMLDFFNLKDFGENEET